MNETVNVRGLVVDVINNDIDRALKKLKKKMQNEGVLQDLKRHEFYTKPGDLRRRKKAQAISRTKKKNLQESDPDSKLEN